MRIKCLDSLRSIEDVHEWLNRCATVFQTYDHNERIIVDLSGLQWVSPVGSAALVATLHKLSGRYDIVTKIPKNDRDEKVIGYLERMDFFKVCPDEIKNAFEKSYDMNMFYNRHRNDQTNGLFELRNTKEDSEVGPLQKSVREIMKGKLSPNRISDIASIVGELAGNSIEHGKTACFPCVQYYSNQKQVEIAICDYGKGIVRSLKNFVSHSTSHEVVEKAITTLASCVQDEDRGRGLLEVKKRTFDWSRIAQFYVRTHDSAYRVYPNRIKLIDQGKVFSGTHYYIIINIS